MGSLQLVIIIRCNNYTITVIAYVIWLHTSRCT